MGVSADEDIDAGAVEATGHGNSTEKTAAKSTKNTSPKKPTGADPKDFKMPVGGPEVLGKKLSEIPRPKLDEIYAWADKQTKLKPKPKNFSDLVNIVTNVKLFLKTLPPTPPPPTKKPAGPSMEPENDIQDFPPDESQLAPALDERDPRPFDPDPADYVVTVGDFSGMALRDISESDVKALYQWADSELKKSPPPKGIAGLIDLTKNIKAFLISMSAWPINLAPGGKK